MTQHLNALVVHVENQPPLTHSYFSELENYQATQLAKHCEVLKKAKLVFINAPALEVIKNIKNIAPQVSIALVTDLPMHEYHLQLDHQTSEWIDHILHRSSELTPLLADNLLNVNIDVLTPADKVSQTYTLKHTNERTNVNNKLFQFIKDQTPIHEQQARHLRSISEELLTNALFDAPIEKGVLTPDKHGSDFSLESQPVTIQLDYDKRYFMITATDPFGSFQKAKFFEYTQKVLRQHKKETLLDDKVGGAGLGILRILFYSQALVVKVRPDQSTQVTAVSYLNQPMSSFAKKPRSFSYHIIKD